MLCAWHKLLCARPRLRIHVLLLPAASLTCCLFCLALECCSIDRSTDGMCVCVSPLAIAAVACRAARYAMRLLLLLLLCLSVYSAARMCGCVVVMRVWNDRPGDSVSLVVLLLHSVNQRRSSWHPSRAMCVLCQCRRLFVSIGWLNASKPQRSVARLLV